MQRSDDATEAPNTTEYTYADSLDNSQIGYDLPMNAIITNDSGTTGRAPPLEVPMFGYRLNLLQV